MKKKGITTWIRKKKVRYAAAGTLCLAVAIGILTLGLGIGSRAGSLTLGTGPDINFDTATDGNGKTIYLIDSAEQMSKLGQASAEQTNGKIFRLKQDLDIRIKSAATGTFAGTFDGDGHVIKINHLRITDSTSGTETQGVSQGALFGTVSGTVENLIIDVTDENASYERISDAGVTESKGTPSKTEADKKYAFDTDTTVNEFSTDHKEKAAYEAIRFTDAFETVYLDTAGNECGKNDADAQEYRKYTSDETESTITTYETKNATQTDTIGILCGAIGQGGTVDRVSLNGDSVSVVQTGKAYPKTITNSTVTPYVYYYKVESADRIEAQTMKSADMELEIPEETEKSSVTASNQALNTLLDMQISAPSKVATENDGAYKINYTISLQSKSGTISKVTMRSSLPGGTFKGLDSNSAITNLTKAGTTITYTYTGNITAGDSVKPVFTALIEDVASGQTVPAKAEASTSIIDGRYSLYTEQTGNSHPLELTVSAPKGMLADDSSATSITTIFDVTVKNTGTEAMKDVQIHYGSDVTPVSDTGLSIDSDEKTVTINGGLSADGYKTVQFRKKASFDTSDSVMITANFSALATLKTTKSKIITVGVEGSTYAYKNEGTVTETKSVRISAIKDKFDVTISAKRMVLFEENDDGSREVTYTIAIKNNNIKDNIGTLYVRSTDGNGKFKEETGYTVSEDGKLITAENIDKEINDITWTEMIPSTTTDTYTKTFEIYTDEFKKPKDYAVVTVKTFVYKGTGSTSSAAMEAEMNGPQKSVRNHTNAGVTYGIRIGKIPSNLKLTAQTGGNWHGTVVSEGNEITSGNKVTYSVPTGTSASGTVTYSTARAGGMQVRIGEIMFSDSAGRIYPPLSMSTVLEDGTAESASVTQTILTGKEISLTAETPAKILRESGGDTYVIYELTPAWGENISGTTKLTASVAGGFGASEDTAKKAIANTEYTVPTATTKVFFARKVGSGDTNISTSFTMTCTSGDVVYWAQTAAVSTEIKEAGEKIKPVQKELGGLVVENKKVSSLRATLSGTPDFLTEGQAITLTLKLENISTGQAQHPIYVSSRLDDWNLKSGAWSDKTYVVNAVSDDTDNSVTINTSYSGNVLEPGASVELTKTINSCPESGKETVNISGVDIYVNKTPSYTYMKSLSGARNSVEQKPVKSTEQIEPGQNLTAGALAGKSEGTITNVRQNMNLTVKKNAAENKGLLTAGGVIGELSGTITDLYLTGTTATNAGGAGNVHVGLVTGKNSDGTLSRAVIPAAVSVDQLGITGDSETIKTGRDASPDTEWTNWKTFSYYENETDTEMTSYFDLGWLVKEKTREQKNQADIFNLAESATNGRVTVGVKQPVTEQQLRYWMVYRARKALTRCGLSEVFQ